MSHMSSEGAERARLAAADAGAEPWREWGPYLAERAWGTVREDYSEWGTAWDYFPHDDARSRTYRWNEDGLAGISDDQQRFCFALAFWNGKDPILKERIFGLGGREEPEYELVDTGIFGENRYWAITADYAKEGPNDLCVKVTVANRGPDEATLHVLPHLWFRNTWAWGLPDHDAVPLIMAGDTRLVGDCV